MLTILSHLFKYCIIIFKINAQDNQVIKKIATELNVNTINFRGGCESGYYVDYSGDAVIFGVGDLGLVHKPNEYVNID